MSLGTRDASRSLHGAHKLERASHTRSSAVANYWTSTDMGYAQPSRHIRPSLLSLNSTWISRQICTEICLARCIRTERRALPKQLRLLPRGRGIRPRPTPAMFFALHSACRRLLRRRLACPLLPRGTSGEARREMGAWKRRCAQLNQRGYAAWIGRGPHGGCSVGGETSRVRTDTQAVARPRV